MRSISMMKTWVVAAAVALAAFASAGNAAAETGHLNVDVDQHVQASFVLESPGSNVYRLAALIFPDGTVRLGAKVPKGSTLVLTDFHAQIFRSGDLSQPLDAFMQLASFDMTGATEGSQLTNIPLVANPNQFRTGSTHSFSAGFAFKGNRSPGLIVFTDASVTDLHLLASGYLARR